MVSIIILTHNAPKYVELTLKSLKRTRTNHKVETIIVDNASEQPTKDLLFELQKEGYIDKLYYGNKNLFFAKGNNLGSRLISPESKYILLLNSDVEIKNEKWLDKMFEIHRGGVTSLGACITEEGRILADGYCFLINRSLYEKYMMNEKFEWHYSIAFLQMQVLKSRGSVRAVNSHNELLVHYGGKSGDDWKKAAGLEKINWYDKWLMQSRNQVELIYSLSEKIGSKKENINLLRGLCEDGWCLRKCDFEIRTGTKGKLIIKGYYPKESTGKEIIEIKINHKRKKYIYGIYSKTFMLEIAAPKNQVIRVSIENKFGFQAPKPDIRELCFLVDDLFAE